jgi:hypothetical protein
LLARNPDKVAGWRAGGDIAALIDAGEQQLNLNAPWFPIRTYLCAGRRI